MEEGTLVEQQDPETLQRLKHVMMFPMFLLCHLNSHQWRATVWTCFHAPPQLLVMSVCVRLEKASSPRRSRWRLKLLEVTFSRWNAARWNSAALNELSSRCCCFCRCSAADPVLTLNATAAIQRLEKSASLMWWEAAAFRSPHQKGRNANHLQLSWPQYVLDRFFPNACLVHFPTRQQ